MPKPVNDRYMGSYFGYEHYLVCSSAGDVIFARLQLRSFESNIYLSKPQPTISEVKATVRITLYPVELPSTGQTYVYENIDARPAIHVTRSSLHPYKNTSIYQMNDGYRKFAEHTDTL